MKNGKDKLMYGCIDEDHFALRSPRVIDGDECKTIEAAMRQALYMLEDGTEQASICRCKYYPEHAAWCEIPGDGHITINAFGAEWLVDDEDED